VIPAELKFTLCSIDPVQVHVTFAPGDTRMAAGANPPSVTFTDVVTTGVVVPPPPPPPPPPGPVG
jgi:hypothetical protein